MREKMLPPRLRDWAKGTPQVGAFIRTRGGSTIEMVNNHATDDQEALVLALIMGPSKIPPEIMRSIRERVRTQIKPPEAGTTGEET